MTASPSELQKEVQNPTPALAEALTEDAVTAKISACLRALSHPDPTVPPTVVATLVELAPDSVAPLLATYDTSTDQSLQAYIIQALARIGGNVPAALRDRVAGIFADVVGTSIANHCQGNVRRVAARGLGAIGCPIAAEHQTSAHQQAMNKLAWALLYPEDWALRYAAIISLEELFLRGVSESLALLQQALASETDIVVRSRLQLAIDRTQTG